MIFIIFLCICFIVLRWLQEVSKPLYSISSIIIILIIFQSFVFSVIKPFMQSLQEVFQHVPHIKLIISSYLLLLIGQVVGQLFEQHEQSTLQQLLHLAIYILIATMLLKELQPILSMLQQFLLKVR